MRTIKQHFEDEAKDFDRLILTLIPHYAQMVEALIAAIPFDGAAPLRAIDLGCGTGTVARAVLEVFPNAHVTCLDLAENMIAMARAKLARYAHVNYIVGDFHRINGNYDVVLSSLALHHLPTDADKQHLYRRIYDSLAPGGVFYTADVVLGSGDFVQAAYLRKWCEFMRRYVSQEEIEDQWIPKYLAEDRPAKLMPQLTWLAEIGFSDVDILWKYYNFAVYGGIKR